MNGQQYSFSRLIELIETMHHRYHKAYSAFWAYDSLNEILASNVVGESKADQNARILNRYGDYIQISKESLRVYFFLELAKLYDTSKESLHIEKIINYTESNLKSLTIDEFVEHNQSRILLEELIENYRGIQPSDITKVRKMMENNNDSINKLSIYRDKWIAHDDIRKPTLPTLNKNEIIRLFDTLKQILNTISGKLNHEQWGYNLIEDKMKIQISHFINDLTFAQDYQSKSRSSYSPSPSSNTP